MELNHLLQKRILHIVGFFAILVPLWVLAPRNTAEAVFTQFTDGGNWGSIGLSCLIGIFSPVFSFIGPDSATHVDRPYANPVTFRCLRKSEIRLQSCHVR